MCDTGCRFPSVSADTGAMQTPFNPATPGTIIRFFHKKSPGWFPRSNQTAICQSRKNRRRCLPGQASDPLAGYIRAGGTLRLANTCNEFGERKSPGRQAAENLNCSGIYDVSRRDPAEPLCGRRMDEVKFGNPDCRGNPSRRAGRNFNRGGKPAIQRAGVMPAEKKQPRPGRPFSAARLTIAGFSENRRSASPAALRPAHSDSGRAR